MTVDNAEVIDAIGKDVEGGVVFLAIFDALDWSDEWEHLHVLQEKINAYLGFVETGQIYEEYPEAAERGLRIDILALHAIPAIASEFLEHAAAVAAQLGIAVAHRVTPMPDLN